MRALMIFHVALIGRERGMDRAFKAGKDAARNPGQYRHRRILRVNSNTNADLFRYRELFGSWSVPYPDFYQPRPYSKSFVQHLEAWYAQSHPDEDFAETFAVWLTPGADWEKRYAGWPALKKLQYVDEVMREIAGRAKDHHGAGIAWLSDPLLHRGHHVSLGH